MRLRLRTDHDRGMVLVELLSDWIILKVFGGLFDSIRMQAKRFTLQAYLIELEGGSWQLYAEGYFYGGQLSDTHLTHVLDLRGSRRLRHPACIFHYIPFTCSHP